MKNIEISKRYAKALFEIATESSQQERFYEELKAVCELMFKDKDLSEFIKSPLIRAKEKEKTIDSALSNRGFSEDMITFLKLLAKKNRLVLLNHITKSFMDFNDDRLGIKRGVVKSSQPVPQEEVESIAKKIEKALDKKIVLECEEDKNLIGGLSVQVGSLSFDDSLNNHLNKITDNLNRSLT